MNRDDVIDILTAIQAVDRRTIGETDVIVWHQLIGDLDRDDALTAARDHFREQPGVWLEPGHIVAGIRAIRNDRYQRQTEHERAQREAIYDAKVADWVAELAAAKTIPDDDTPLRYTRPSANPTTAPVLRIACPYCRASVGQRCTNSATKRQLQAAAHPARLTAAAARHEHDTAVPLCTACGTKPLITDDDTTRGICTPCRNAATPQPPETEASNGNHRQDA